MQIKVFKAATMKEAMQQVKDELGRDAVILHTKKYREGGFLGYHSKEVVEVTAAVEDQVEKPKKKVKRQALPKAETTALKGSGLDVVIPPAPVMPPTSVLTQYKTNGTPTGVEMAQNLPNMTPIAPPIIPPVTNNVEITPPPVAMPVAPAPQPVATTPVSEPAASVEQAKATPDEASRPEDAAKIQKLEDELAQMKTLLAQVMSKDVPKDKVTLQEALRRQEVSDEIIKKVAATLPAGTTLLDSSDPEAKAALAGFLADNINFTDGIALNKHGVRIVALIGATGVGKTTTLAKIAAKFVLEKNIKAALITADTYRISAVEQLKTYSDIIGLPLEIVYSPDELKVAIHKHRDKDLILVDTAGRSQHNEYQMQELQDFLAVNSHIERHLVLSATTKNRDAADILAKFSVCKPDKVIFTKVDETSSVGLIVNLLADSKIGLAFVTNGQSVPDDITPATPENLAELLLRD